MNDLMHFTAERYLVNHFDKQQSHCEQELPAVIKLKINVARISASGNGYECMKLTFCSSAHSANTVWAIKIGFTSPKNGTKNEMMRDLNF